jgi:hypothetical protein
MTSIFVQFSDASQESVISAFSCPQNIEAWPNQGEIDSSDPRWKAYYSSIPDGPLKHAWPSPDE